MRRETFIKAIDSNYAEILEYGIKLCYDADSAEDVVQDALVSILENKSYTRLESEKEHRAVAFLKVAVRYSTLTHLAKDTRRRSVVGSIESADTEVEDPFDKTDFREREKADDECPFCHKTVSKTMYKDIACPHCHTIIGHARALAQGISVTDDELIADVPDMDMIIDVQSAMSTLTLIEREIMEAFILRHTSLDDLSLIYDMDRFSLRRIFLRAKDKMKKELATYETV